MATTPWVTSNKLIEAVKRNFSVPIAQGLLTTDDILAFANEEMMISQVPSILQFHEEFFVYKDEIPLVSTQVRYPIPERAIGMRLRDIFYKDSSGNLVEMERINADDKAYFQDSWGYNGYLKRYYIENNTIVLAPEQTASPTGTLLISYFLRPNQLVADEQAAVSNAFSKQLTIDNTTLVAGNTISIGSKTFTAVAGSPAALEFQIGANSITTATNLTVAINTDGTYSANNGSPSTNIITVEYQDQSVVFNTNNTNAVQISTKLGVKFNNIPSNITNLAYIDFLQTRPGHKTYVFKKQVPNNGISGSYIYFDSGVVPSEFVPGDYICLENECIIPQIPTDLHISLIQRTGNRIMAAIGDQIGLQNSDKKLSEIETRQGTLIDNRVEGSTPKITARRGLLNLTKMGYRRRF